MAKKHKPRAGSLAFYPRKKAARERPSFRSITPVDVAEGEKAKPVNFLGYKVGMTHVIGKDSHEKGSTFGQDINIPVTVIETPPMKVFGVRIYSKAEKGYGIAAAFDVLAEKHEKDLLRKLKNFKKPSTKEKKKEGKEVKKARTMADVEAIKDKIKRIVLLAYSQPSLAGFAKKTPDISEVAISGNTEQQLEYAKEILGKEVAFGDAFTELEFIDAKAVTKGKGMQGPVKRFGIKIHRPKAKKRRVVGSISPWNPSTVMWTVPRPGQMGYHNRTVFNKKVLKISNVPSEVNSNAGFKHYGLVKGSFILVAGSVPGPAKRAIGIRKNIRHVPREKHKIEGIDFIATRPSVKGDTGEEKILAKVEVQKEVKKETKSVADEIAAAVKGEKK